MLDAYLYLGKRSPFGRYGGALSGVRPDDLLGSVLKAVVDEGPFKAEDIDDVIIGCLNTRIAVDGQTWKVFHVTSLSINWISYVPFDVHTCCSSSNRYQRDEEQDRNDSHSSSSSPKRIESSRRSALSSINVTRVPHQPLMISVPVW